MHTKAPIVAVSLAIFAGSVLTSRALAQDYGIDFVTVGAPGNEAFNKPNWEDYPNSPALGRGRVDYTFRMAKYETTTAQYLEFANTFYGVDRNSLPPFLSGLGPIEWGAGPDRNYHGPGRQWTLDTLPGSAMRPVFGISWRDAALYCNWLNNGKSSDPASLLYGAYDVSTWGDNADGSFSDGLTHLPGAKYYLPTYDEALKASHYDPNRDGQGQGGWWLNKNGSDFDPIPGPPGVGETSYGWTDGFGGEYLVPLGSYPDSLSPWGLLDTSGGAPEWTERAAPKSGPSLGRTMIGSRAGTGHGGDSIYEVTSTSPSSTGLYGFRIASAIPAPGEVGVALGLGIIVLQRRRKEFGT
ncbi:MAG: SUMF1/EgtB/PvdO family nonheme iron enzyme [Phycisphaerales bacterium]|nr:SUMF1/EgtB/PvdO family nonheme iron enzyme [Phycisphaerales bacterium]